MLIEHYEKKSIILHRCPFEGWPNWAWPIQPISWFLPKRMGWLCPVRSALKRKPVQDFNSFSIMFYYIISTTYPKIGDLFCPVILNLLSAKKRCWKLCSWKLFWPFLFCDDFSDLWKGWPTLCNSIFHLFTFWRHHRAVPKRYHSSPHSPRG